MNKANKNKWINKKKKTLSNANELYNSKNLNDIVKKIILNQKKNKEKSEKIQLNKIDKKKTITKKATSKDLKNLKKLKDINNQIDLNSNKLNSIFKSKKVHRKTQSNINQFNLSKNLNKKILNKYKIVNKNIKKKHDNKSNNIINKCKNNGLKSNIKMKKIVNKKHVKNKLSWNIDKFFYNKNLIKKQNISNNIIKSQNISKKINKKIASKNNIGNNNNKIVNNKKKPKKKTHKKNLLSVPFENNTNSIIKNLNLPVEISRNQKISMTPDISLKNSQIIKSRNVSFVSYVINEEELSDIESDSLKNSSKTKRINQIKNSPNNLLQSTNNLNKKECLIKKIENFTSTNKEQIIKTTWDFYEFKKFLGEGAYAKVYLAESILLKKQCAIKAYDKGLIKNKETSKKIFQEIMILQKLNQHDNIIKLYEIFENKSYIFIVLEFVKDGDLFSNIKNKGAWKKDKVLILFKQLIKGLYYINNKNIIHRDIKLDNILINLDKLKIKIADFGVSKIVKDSNKMIFDFIGTPAYLAPEIIKNKGYKGYSIDVWSLGVSIYFLLYGNVPFNGDDIEELYKNIETQGFEFNDHIQVIDEEFKFILSSMLNKDYKKRITIKELRKSKYLFPSNENLKETVEKKNEINYNTIKIIEGFGFSHDDIVYSLENKKINHIFALYHLIEEN